MEKSFIPIMKLLIVLVTSIVIPLLFSCEDKDEDEFTFYDTYIDGYIKDYHTGEPVVGLVFDAKYYTKNTTGGWFSPDPYYALKVAVSNAQGYYKIRVPKAWNNEEVLQISAILRDVENYRFNRYSYPLEKDYSYVEEGLKTRSKREVDIRPITYGFLKVILPKSSNQGWHIGLYPYIYETPYYIPEFINSDTYNDSLNYLFIKVPVATGIINNAGTETQFTVNNPRDTTIIYVNME